MIAAAHLQGALLLGLPLHQARNGPCALRIRCEAPSQVSGADHGDGLVQSAGSIVSCPIRNAVTKKRYVRQSAKRPEGKKCRSGICTVSGGIDLCLICCRRRMVLPSFVGNSACVLCSCGNGWRKETEKTDFQE